jgi:hypothetical protein
MFSLLFPFYARYSVRMFAASRAGKVGVRLHIYISMNLSSELLLFRVFDSDLHDTSSRIPHMICLESKKLRLVVLSITYGRVIYAKHCSLPDKSGSKSATDRHGLCLYSYKDSTSTIATIESDMSRD